MRRPKVPTRLTRLFTVLGWMPISYVELDGSLGRVRYDHRQMQIREDMGDVAVEATIGHELMHVVLWDGGVSQVLDERQVEAVCDAFGTWYAAAVGAGVLTLTDGRKTGRISRKAR